MPAKLHYDKGRLFNIQISESAYLFINRFATGRLHEPRHRTVDRIIGTLRMSEQYPTYEENVQLKERNAALALENKQLREQLQANKQTRFSS